MVGARAIGNMFADDRRCSITHNTTSDRITSLGHICFVAGREYFVCGAGILRAPESAPVLNTGYRAGTWWRYGHEENLAKLARMERYVKTVPCCGTERN